MGTLATRTDVEDFVRGCTFYATGGGGLPVNGIASLAGEQEAGRSIGWSPPEAVDDDATVACPFLMGSIAPHTPEILAEMRGFGFGRSVNTEKDRMRQALEELALYAGRRIDAIVPIELAGANTSAALAAASELGIPVLDGDFTGRAIPEILQTTPCLAGHPLAPIASVDEWGNVALIKHGINPRVTERLGKLISANGYGLAGQAGFLMSGREAKRFLVGGTLSACLDLGRFIRERRARGGCVVGATMAHLGGWVLGRGRVAAKDDEDRLGYYWGTYRVEGADADAGRSFKVWFKNENHVLWRDDQPLVTSPDIIALVDRTTGEPIPNPLVEPGQEVALVGLPAPGHFRSAAGLAVLGPRYFGFDIDYRPIEEAISSTRGAA
jgi:DUF917 family protein